MKIVNEKLGKIKYTTKRPSLAYTRLSIINLKNYYPEVRVTTFVVVFAEAAAVGVGLTVGIPPPLPVAPDTPLCFLSTLFSALLSRLPPPLESVPKLSSPAPFLREGSVRLRVTPTVVDIAGL